MKEYFLSIGILLCLSSNSQTTIKKGCEVLSTKDQEKKVATDIAAVVQGYTLALDTTIRGEHLFVFENKDEDELQVWFYSSIVGENADLKQKGHVEFKLTKVVGQYLTISKIYTDYFGRVYNAEAVRNSEYDSWQVMCNGKKKSVSFQTAQQKGYWYISL